MLTKDLIKLLQEVDPEGNIHISNGTDAITGVYKEVGYWDGSYAYMKDKQLVITSSGSKVVLQTKDWESVVWDCEGDLDEIKEKLKIDMSPFVGAKEKEVEFWNQIKAIAFEAKKNEQFWLKEMLFDVLFELNKGAKIIHDKDEPLTHYNSMYYLFPDGEKHRLNQGSCGVILKSNFLNQ